MLAQNCPLMRAAAAWRATARPPSLLLRGCTSAAPPRRTATTPTTPTPTPPRARPLSSPVPAAATDRATITTEQQHQQLDWRACWYAVAFEADVDKEAPYAFQLLGQRLVVWFDRQQEAWRCFADACPHKLALLSEGRIASNGELECPYHGWRWDGHGKCTAVPQAAAGTDPASSPRACATAFPCRAAQGIIFVKPTAMAWPKTASPASADDNDDDLPLVPELEQGGQRAWLGEGTTVVSDTWRDVPLDFSTVMSNLLDASHLSFTHHKSISNRRIPNIYDIELEGEITEKGFRGIWSTGPRSGAFGPQAGAFVAPNLMRQKIDGRAKRGVEAMVIAYVTPSAPGRCRLLNRNTISFVGGRGEREGAAASSPSSAAPPAKRPLPAILAGLLPRFAGHLATQVPLEDDQIFLHGAEEELWRRRAEGLTDGRAQYLPSAPKGADAFERAFRAWLSAFAGGGPFGRPGVDSSADLPPRLSRTQLLDRYEQHTQSCATCSRALKRVRAAKKAARAVASALALLAAFCGAVGVAGNSSGGGSVPSSLPPPPPSSLGEWAGGLKARALGLALAAGAAVAGGAGGPEAAVARALVFAALAAGSAALASALGRLEEAFLRGTWPPPRNLDKE
jgi:nitrite reductase/ring-hydroxylating ferredoxin subunit